MFAVIETGGKQYKVEKDDVITVEKLKASGGEKVQFNSVLLTGGEKVQIGDPHVKGAGVQAIVLEQVKSKKVVSFVKRRRKSSSKTKKGHRQQLTLIKIIEILNTGADKSNIAKYWGKVGCNCVTGVYEPFGYTICETLDRMVPAIVQNIDGPKEILDEFSDCVYTYSVSSDYNKDIDNFYKAFEKFMATPPKVRKANAIKARKALDPFRPENISKQWQKLFEDIFED